MSALFSTEIKKILDLFREKSKNDSSEKIESRKMYGFPSYAKISSHEMPKKIISEN